MDPCSTTVINTWSIAPRTVRNGEVDVYEFAEATDTVQVYNNVNTLCGPREYTVLNPDGSAVAYNGWVSVAKKTGSTTQYEITSKPMNELVE